MKKNLNYNKKAFSFIELIVVTLIIWIIWFFSFWSFIEFYKSKEFVQKINSINSFIQEKDFKIKKKKIFDYEINFKKNEKYFFSYENIFEEKALNLKQKTDNKIIFEKNNKLKNNILNKKINVFIYKNWKFIKKILLENNKLEINYKEKETIKNEELIQENNNYEFKFFLDEEELNSIFINKFDLENNFILKEISDSKEKINVYNSMKIENIWWRKKIFLDNLEKKEVYLFFESNNGNENYLLIKI